MSLNNNIKYSMKYVSADARAFDLSVCQEVKRTQNIWGPGACYMVRMLHIKLHMGSSVLSASLTLHAYMVHVY